MNDNPLLERIAVNPNVMAGKPVIKGTRIPVELLALMAAQGLSDQDILSEYPHLTAEGIQAALNYSAAMATS